MDEIIITEKRKKLKYKNRYKTGGPDRTKKKTKTKDNDEESK